MQHLQHHLVASIIGAVLGTMFGTATVVVVFNFVPEQVVLERVDAAVLEALIANCSVAALKEPELLEHIRGLTYDVKRQPFNEATWVTFPLGTSPAIRDAVYLACMRAENP